MTIARMYIAISVASSIIAFTLQGSPLKAAEELLLADCQHFRKVAAEPGSYRRDRPQHVAELLDYGHMVVGADVALLIPDDLLHLLDHLACFT